MRVKTRAQLLIPTYTSVHLLIFHPIKLIPTYTKIDSYTAFNPKQFLR